MNYEELLEGLNLSESSKSQLVALGEYALSAEYIEQLRKEAIVNANCARSYADDYNQTQSDYYAHNATLFSNNASFGLRLADELERAAETPVMTPNWTTERPKKPGDYWFSLPVANRVLFASPDVVRCVVFASECALPSLYVSWMDADGCCRILSLQKDKLDGALWAPRETPADPFEEVVT